MSNNQMADQDKEKKDITADVATAPPRSMRKSPPESMIDGLSSGSNNQIADQEKKEKEQLLMFTRVLMKYLALKDTTMQAQAKAQIKECYEKKKSGESFTASVKTRLSATVGELYWKEATEYFHNFQKQKTEQNAQKQRQQQLGMIPEATPSVHNDARPSIIFEVASSAPTNAADSIDDVVDGAVGAGEELWAVAEGGGAPSSIFHTRGSSNNTQDKAMVLLEEAAAAGCAKCKNELNTGVKTTAHHDKSCPKKYRGQKNRKRGNCDSSDSSMLSEDQNKRRSSRLAGKKKSSYDLPEELQGLDPELVKRIEAEIVDPDKGITFDDIAGLEGAKGVVRETVILPMKRPDIFVGLRKPAEGLLLFAPPGTGKTLIGKAIANDTGATFFSIKSSSLASKWHGNAERLVRTLFAVVAWKSPSVIFFDELDSLLCQRKSDDDEVSKRVKTEFLAQLDGIDKDKRKGNVLMIGATNKPHELDDAARRRFVKRLYVPLPIQSTRVTLLQNAVKTMEHDLTKDHFAKLSKQTDGYSGADLMNLCKDAAMGPVRDVGDKILTIAKEDLPRISYCNFRKSLRSMKPSVAEKDLAVYEDWNAMYGTKTFVGEDSESDSDEE